MNLKHFILTITIVFSCLLLATAKKKPFTFLNAAVPVESDYLYASEGEVSNIQYREFLSYIKKTKGIDAYWQMHPDTNVWRQKLGYHEPFVEYYLQHPAYKEYPVVGVSKEQATAYCTWLTEILSKDLPKGIKRIAVRLPTKKEWENAARGGHPEYTVPNGVDKYRMGTGDKRRFQGYIMYNFKRKPGFLGGVASVLSDGGVITTPVFSYWPNDYGLYNMSGNVAEMVLDDSIVKGGSWSSSGHYMKINANDYGLNSNKPSSEVGFRYFIEVMEYDISPGCGAFKSKWITNEMEQVDSNIYAHKTECTNLDFKRFLFSNPQYTPIDSNWLLLGAREFSKKYSWHIDYFEYPVVNITYEAAIEYCKWLTIKTNLDPKRKYKKVVFRLPTKKEWEFAANGGRESNMYPWGGPYVRNSRGCHLANYNPIPQQHKKTNAKGKTDLMEINKHVFENKGEDGAEYMTSCKSYYPNGFGLYNCAGNAAEMTSTRGLAKGGSWGSTAPYMVINADLDKESSYLYSRVYLPNSDTSPFLGFRYFMEVIEY